MIKSRKKKLKQNKNEENMKTDYFAVSEIFKY